MVPCHKYCATGRSCPAALNAAVSPEQFQFLDIIVSTLIFFVRRITDGFKMLAYFRGTLNFNPFEYKHKPGP